MNNEPVAWMSEFGQFIGKVQDEICHIPLYTHLAKTLTDEEIENLIRSCSFDVDAMFSEGFANEQYLCLESLVRETIKKASENG